MLIINSVLCLLGIINEKENHSLVITYTKNKKKLPFGSISHICILYGKTNTIIDIWDGYIIA